jgi:hypothetical protein
MDSFGIVILMGIGILLVVGLALALSGLLSIRKYQ